MVIVGAIVAGCGSSSSSGSGSITLPNGQTVNANAALSWNITSNTCTGTALFASGIPFTANPIALTTTGTSCGSNGCWLTANQQSIIVVPYVVYGPSAMVSTTLPAGTYNVGQALPTTAPASGTITGAIIYYVTTDSTCGVSTTNTVLTNATGTVTLTTSPSQSNNGQAQGSFNIQVPAAAGHPSGNLTGTFSTAGCNSVNTTPWCLSSSLSCGGVGCSP
jgi:hypothetical protein